MGNNPAEEVQMARRERRKFTDEYKAEVVALVRSTGKGIAAISRDLDLPRRRFANGCSELTSMAGRATD